MRGVPKFGCVTTIPYCGTEASDVPALLFEGGLDVSAVVSEGGRFVAAPSSLEPPPQPTSNIENNVNGTIHRRFFIR